MADLTPNQLSAIFSVYLEGYLDGVKVLTKQAGESTLNLDEGSYEYFGSSETGTNGHFLAVKDGSSGMITLPNVQILDKHFLLNSNPDTVSAGTTATSASDPSAGALLFASKTVTTNGVPLVIYPHITTRINGTTVSYGSDTSNPFALLVPHAILDSRVELTMGTANLTNFPLSFKCLVDRDTDYNSVSNVYAIMDDGIDTDGTYTP